jgi:hypothetical protein
MRQQTRVNRLIGRGRDQNPRAWTALSPTGRQNLVRCPPGRRARPGGFAGFQQGLEAGDDIRPADADHLGHGAAGLEAVVDDGQLHALSDRPDVESDGLGVADQTPWLFQVTGDPLAQSVCSSACR